MKSIYKYPFAIADRNYIEMPEGAVILRVGLQNHTPCLWALVDLEQKRTAMRLVFCFGTGWELAAETDISAASKENYIGTLLTNNDSLVWHFFDGGREMKTNHDIDDIMNRIFEWSNAEDYDLDDTVYEECGAHASNINNGGLRDQIRFLLEECAWTVDQVLEETGVPPAGRKGFEPAPDITVQQVAITLGKLHAGYRPGADGWTADDQQALDYATGKIGRSE